METKQYALTAAQRTDAALAAGRTDEAVRLSGEATATLDAEWTGLYNRKSAEADAALVAANFIACRHLEALMAAGMAEEAFATALMLMYRSTMALRHSAEVEKSQLDIALRAVNSLLEAGERRGLTQGDEATVDHFAHILTYLASMLYALYKNVGDRYPDFPVLEDAYAALSQLQEIGAVQYPEVRVADKDIPAGDIPAIMPDLLGRARSLGLLTMQ